MKKITVLGFHGKANIGDDAYKLAFPAVFSNCNFSFTDQIECCLEADQYVLGGGDILSDEMIDKITNQNEIWHTISTSASENLNTKKLNKFKTIVVRDKQSVQITKNNNPIYAPDLSFSLQPNKDNGIKIIQSLFKKQNRELYDNTIAIVLNGYLIDNHETNFNLKRFLDFQKLSFHLGQLMDSTAASFIFIPFGRELPWDDRVPNSWVMQKAKFWQKNISINDELGVQDTLDIIAACDIVISTRLHSTIFSIISCVPFIDITHNHKNQWLIETLGLEEFSIPYTSFDDIGASKMIKMFLNDKERYSKKLSKITEEQRKLLGDINHVFDM